MLDGIRVLDFSLQLPGPYCTYVLAELGADVVKVEPPPGDPARGFASAIFPQVNAGKRSLVLDLKRPRGREVAARLAAAADVVVEGFRPGVADRLGIGRRDLTANHPDLVYCSLSGFGQDGPLSREPGHDVTYLALSGALSIPGSWGEEIPARSAIPMADLGAGLYAALAIVSALLARANGGGGRAIDVAIADVAFAWAATRRANELQGTEVDPRMHLLPTNGVFQARDGRALALGVIEDAFWHKLVAAVADVEPRLGDARFATEPGRRAHGDEVHALLVALFASRDRDEWVTLLAAGDVPVQPVISVPEAAARPQLAGRGLVVDDGEGSARRVRMPVVFTPPAPRGERPAPALGGDAEAVLREVGYRDPDIAELRAEGVLG